MDDILEDREEMEGPVDGINVNFKVAAFVASTETVDDIQLPLVYVMESSIQGIAREITFEDTVDEEELHDSIQGDGASDLDLKKIWEGFSD